MHPNVIPPKKKLAFWDVMSYLRFIGGFCGMDYAKLDRICAMYSGGMLLKDICFEVGLSSAHVLRYLQRARALGDVRARGRRPADAVSRCELVRQMLEASDDGFVGQGEIVGIFWPDGVVRPATWRVLVRLAVSDCRRKFGMVVEVDRKRGGYRLVK